MSEDHFYLKKTRVNIIVYVIFLYRISYHQLGQRASKPGEHWLTSLHNALNNLRE